MVRYRKNNSLARFLLILLFGLAGAFLCQFFSKEPGDRKIHIRNFRYGKDPAVIRCNRGDTLHLTFSSDDTGHSFFLEEFDIDAKVNASSNEVMVYKTSDPSALPQITEELILIARHKGILNYLVSKSYYRCHVWCGPLHAFEQGKLIIMPNTLLFFSLGSLIGIILLWVYPLRTTARPEHKRAATGNDLLEKWPFLRKILISRWPQIALMIIAMFMIYVVIITSVFGTKMSGRNLGVMLMWVIWLFLLIIVMTPFGGRIWCSICPLPFLGDWIQRRSFNSPAVGKIRNFNNKFFGLFLKWPARLDNNWPRIILFMVLATFSTTLVAIPRMSGMIILLLMLIPLITSSIWELRSFCRYLCPVSVFVAPFSNMSIISLKNISQEKCNDCKTHFCHNGNAKGWACPYGINAGEPGANTDCGLCLECLRSCTYNNISIFRRPFASEFISRSVSESWLCITIFTVAVVYSILYLGHWPEIRDFINIVDKGNWNLFGMYSILFWGLTLILIPGLLYLLAGLGNKFSKTGLGIRNIFFSYSGSLLPAGLMFWASFVIPMLFVNITFIKQSFSDPFGWGWDFFDMANTPWHQFLSPYIPWIQAILVLSGLYLSLRNLNNSLRKLSLKNDRILAAGLPFAIFIIPVSVFMLFFFTN